MKHYSSTENSFDSEVERTIITITWNTYLKTK